METVTIDKQPPADINCSTGTCSQTFLPRDTSVTLMASADPGSVFAGLE